MIDHDAFMALRDNDRRHEWGDRETILYALAAGMGGDPLDARELRFVLEGTDFVAMPTLAVVLARSALYRSLPIKMTMVLHGGQFLRLHRPLPTSGEVIADTRLTQLIDKGAGKSALITYETAARTVEDGMPLFTTGGTLVARGEGGFGGPSGRVAEPHAIPDRLPDHRHVTDTRPDQALLYRLTGDRNPIHADPKAAARAGFPRPILHGLCTYAIACRAVLASVCDYDPALIREFDVRFSAPVFPGDRIVTEMWRDGPILCFRCRVEDRGAIVLDNGRCRLEAYPPHRQGRRARQCRHLDRLHGGWHLPAGAPASRA